jgi:uncharacterized protein YecT (DUF1311 family)
MKAITACLLLAPLLAIGHGASAQHMNSKDAPCRGQVATADLYRCFNSAEKDADRQLNVLYTQIQAKLSPGDRKALQSAQRLWLQFRDATCEAERALYGGGTGGPVASVACLEEETRLRTNDLLSTYGWRLQK